MGGVIARSIKRFLSAAALTWLTLALSAQNYAVRGRIDLVKADGSARRDNNAGIVVWLTPASGQPVAQKGSARPRPRIVQQNKRFLTRVLAVQVGSVVEFPNEDPFFHNVFSLLDGQKFDLGLYEAGSTKSVAFNRAGVCYIFCNIHSQMNATVVVVDTPHFVVLSTPGEFQIPQVPPGRYQLRVWAERCSPEALSEATQSITVEGSAFTLETIRLRESRDVGSVHTNKYGKSYEAPVFSTPIYTRP